MSKASVQFVEIVRAAYALLQEKLERRWCYVCEVETDQEGGPDGRRCLVCGYVERP